MPSKYPVSTPDEVIKVLKKAGFDFVSQKGSHIKYSNGMHVVIIPDHKEIKRFTLKSILEQADMDLEEFLLLRK